MRKLLLTTLSILIVLILTSCSGVSQSEYDKLMDEKIELESQIQTLESQVSALQSQLDSAKKAEADDVILKTVLANTYDAYRYMMLYVTTEVYGNSFSKSEWDSYITNDEHPVPTFEELQELVN
jgi:outer membrane murein-binding lipoprotein Lpp